MIVKTIDNKGYETCVCYNHPRKYTTTAFKDGTDAIKVVMYLPSGMYNAWLPVFTEWWAI